LTDSVKKLDKINNIEVSLEGDLKKIIDDPIKWAEEQSDKALDDNIDRYLEAKELGEEFWDEIESIS
tara:strand:- start:805 stop:1005 length:201 start_codon:yes stop_codon:yes gene_type:complete